MTTTRRRKTPIRSVAIRRVKPRKSQIAKRTHKRRKSRNIVMRGGAGDISLYGDRKIDVPTKCIIIKKKRLGVRDDLYLFFHKDTTLDEIQKFVCDAMGLADGVSFTPNFMPRASDVDKHKLNDLFIKLSGNWSYTTIESGYLQRDEKSENKEVVTSREHKITSPQSSAPEIKKWDDVISKLGFREYDCYYKAPTTYTAEDGYFTVYYIKKSTQERQQQDADMSCRMKIIDINGPNRKDSISYLTNSNDKRLKVVRDIALENKQNGMTKEENSKSVREYLDLFKNENDENYRTSAYDYDSNVSELRKMLDTIKQNPEYQALSDQCKTWYESQFTKYKTIDEIVSEVYAANSS